MTGLKNIENQRAFEKAQREAKEEPSYKLLKEIYDAHLVGTNLLNKPNFVYRVEVCLNTGILLNQSAYPDSDEQTAITITI